MRVFKLITFLFSMTVLCNCSPKYHLAGTYQSDLFSSNFIIVTLKLDRDSMATYWKIGDVFNIKDLGFYKVTKDTLRIFYSSPHFTAADRDSFIKYKILPFPLSQSEIEARSSDNYFLIRNNKLLYLDSLGNRWKKYNDKKHRTYFLKKVQ